MQPNPQIAISTAQTWAIVIVALVLLVLVLWLIWLEAEVPAPTGRGR